MISVSDIKTVGLVLIISACIWFYKDYQVQREELARLIQNQVEMVQKDSTGFESLSLKPAEIQEYLVYNNPELLKKLQDSNIKLSKLESLISMQIAYQNDSIKSSDMSNMIQSIRQDKKDSLVFFDDSRCLKISGYLHYDKDSLKLSVHSRKVAIQGDAARWMERKKWRFLFIKSNFLGKWQLKNKVFTDCGEIQITNMKNEN